MSEGQGALMDSLTPRCTPLKHRYDKCFNDWFKDYLQVASNGDTDKSNGSWNAAGFFGGDKLGQLRVQYENDCGALFRDYQVCVQAAVNDLDLGRVIARAREGNAE